MQYVIVNPYEHPDNDYIRLQIEAIRKAGYTCTANWKHYKKRLYSLQLDGKCRWQS